MAGHRTGRVQTGGVSTGPYEPSSLAEAAANGGMLLLSSFALVEPGEGGVVDLDLDRHVPAAWVVGRDTGGAWWSSRVALEQDPLGGWMATGEDTSSWDGWSTLACSPRPLEEWPAWGVVLALAHTGGAGVPGLGYLSVCGLAVGTVAAVQFGWPGKSRRRIVETATGGFLLSVPVPPGGMPSDVPVLRLVDGRGGTIARL